LSSKSPTGSEMVVFDVDDTLYLERDYVASGFDALEPIVQAKLGVAGFSSTAWKLFVGGDRGDIFDKALTILGVPYTTALVGDLVTAYRTHEPDIELLSDARSGLAGLRASGRSIGVLTDGPESSQRAKVEALGLHTLVDRIVLTGAYGPGFSKPHPRGFLDLVDRRPCGKFAYIADNPRKDFSTPRRLGWRTVRVLRPGGLHHGVPHGPDVDDVVTDLNTIHELLT
jgi:putative hydrolase of the HAD superfamily